MQTFTNNDIKNFIRSCQKDEVRFENVIFQDEDYFKFNSVKLCYVFYNCHFKSHRYDFVISDSGGINEYRAIVFKNCVIDSEIFILNSELENIELTDCQVNAKNFVVAESKIKRLGITNKLESSCTIDNLHFHNNESIEFMDFRLVTLLHSLTIEECIVNKLYMAKSKFNRMNFKKITISDTLTFWDSTVSKGSTFVNCDIFDSMFRGTEISRSLNFLETVFRQNTSFENFKKSKNSELRITKSTFDKKVFFDNSFLSFLIIDTVFFSDIVSFQNFECDKIELNRTHFDKVAFFNDIKINLIKNLDLKTYGIIKNQLNKTDNKIDYIKMNAHEQRKHFQSLTWKNADFYILGLNQLSNDFGRNWIKGVWFTMKLGILFFLLLLSINNFVKSSYPLVLNVHNKFESMDSILAEFLKFMFSFGYSTPVFQSNGWLLLIFIIAKIFIGFGIYQTIVAFRKFK